MSTSKQYLLAVLLVLLSLFAFGSASAEDGPPVVCGVTVECPIVEPIICPPEEDSPCGVAEFRIVFLPLVVVQ